MKVDQKSLLVATLVLAIMLMQMGIGRRSLPKSVSQANMGVEDSLKAHQESIRKKLQLETHDLRAADDEIQDSDEEFDSDSMEDESESSVLQVVNGMNRSKPVPLPNLPGRKNICVRCYMYVCEGGKSASGEDCSKLKSKECESDPQCSLHVSAEEDNARYIFFKRQQPHKLTTGLWFSVYDPPKSNYYTAKVIDMSWEDLKDKVGGQEVEYKRACKKLATQVVYKNKAKQPAEECAAAQELCGVGKLVNGYSAGGQTVDVNNKHCWAMKTGKDRYSEEGRGNEGAQRRGKKSSDDDNEDVQFTVPNIRGAALPSLGSISVGQTLLVFAAVLFASGN